jgi:hypothetical protein
MTRTTTLQPILSLSKLTKKLAQDTVVLPLCFLRVFRVETALQFTPL